ncbi:MAG TPA: hypothetical protein VGK63_12145, partial [Candidatus Limnocylindrales bacterium]
AGEAIEGLGEEQYNPFLEDGGAPGDEGTAGLAASLLAASERSDDGGGDDFNPFLGGESTEGEGDLAATLAGDADAGDEASGDGDEDGTEA